MLIRLVQGDWRNSTPEGGGEEMDGRSHFEWMTSQLQAIDLLAVLLPHWWFSTNEESDDQQHQSECFNQLIDLLVDYVMMLRHDPVLELAHAENNPSSSSG